MIRFVGNAILGILCVLLVMTLVYRGSDTGRYFMFRVTDNTIGQDQYEFIKAQRLAQGDVSDASVNVTLPDGGVGVALFGARGTYLATSGSSGFRCDGVDDNSKGDVYFPTECPSVANMKKLAAELGKVKALEDQARSMGVISGTPG